MTQQQRRFFQTMLFCLLLLIGSTFTAISSSSVVGYFPIVGHQTQYNYGFTSIQPNKTAADILYWTEAIVSNGTYTLKWQQYVNLSIAVINQVFVFNAFQTAYNFSVEIHSNHVAISNSSWNLDKIMNDSVPTPIPTGIDSGIYVYPAHEGVPGFFLSEDTIINLTTGNNVTIGDTLWNSVTPSTYNIEGNNENCYQLYNLSITANERLETTYQIDQDVGIYYSANDTRTLTVGEIVQVASYYYSILETTVPLVASPNSLPTIIVIIIIAIILVIAVILIGRILYHRWRRIELPPLPEENP